MKTPEEIKKGLECCAYVNAPCEGCPFITDISCECIQHMSKCALTYIHQLENHIGELTKKVSQFEAAQPKWISVKEKLPENDDNYLVFTSDRNDAVIATYYGDGEWLEYDLTNLIPLVTHWMPLPEPPKDKEGR